MAGLWLAARLSAVGAPYAVYALLDMLLLPWVATVLIRVLLRAGSRRNLPLGAILLLLLLAAANLAFHASVMGWLAIDPLRALHAGLALVVLTACQPVAAHQADLSPPILFPDRTPARPVARPVPPWPMKGSHDCHPDPSAALPSADAKSRSCCSGGACCG